MRRARSPPDSTGGGGDGRSETLGPNDACATGDAECAAAEKIFNPEQMKRLRVDAKGNIMPSCHHGIAYVCTWSRHAYCCTLLLYYCVHTKRHCTCIRRHTNVARYTWHTQSRAHRSQSHVHTNRHTVGRRSSSRRDRGLGGRLWIRNQGAQCVLQVNVIHFVSHILHLRSRV